MLRQIIRKAVSFLPSVASLAGSFIFSRIKNAKLKYIAKKAIKHAQGKMPDSPDHEVVKKAIKYFQDLTPDNILTDKEVKDIIEQIYFSIKRA